MPELQPAPQTETNYQLLERLGHNHVLAKGPIRILIQKEEFCPDTGGSCMEFNMIELDPTQPGFSLKSASHAHITDANIVQQLTKRMLENGEFVAVPNPNLDEMMQTIREISETSRPQ